MVALPRGQAQGPLIHPTPLLVPTERWGRKRPHEHDYPIRSSKFIRCLRLGKALCGIDERDTIKIGHKCERKQDMPLWKRTYRCENENCDLVMDRDENSAVNLY